MKFSFDEIVKRALKEDIGSGDVTTRFFLSPAERFTGTVCAKEKGVVCGVKVAEKVFRLASKPARIKIHVRDGSGVRPGTRIMTVTGDRNILTAERTALNFLQRLSGIATLTSKFVERVKGTKARILDTRKTAPGLRHLEKYAVACGGGTNHRTGLYDAVLIKDNHLTGIMTATEATEAKEEFVKKQIMQIRKKYPKMTIEMEAQNLTQVRLALDCAVDIILLDNMPESILRRAIAVIRSRPSLELSGSRRPSPAPPSTPIPVGVLIPPHTMRGVGAGAPDSPKAEGNPHPTRGSGPLIEISGGVNLKTAGVLARLGPDRISVGQLTHSPKALDISFEIK